MCVFLATNVYSMVCSRPKLCIQGCVFHIHPTQILVESRPPPPPPGCKPIHIYQATQLTGRYCRLTLLRRGVKCGAAADCKYTFIWALSTMVNSKNWV